MKNALLIWNVLLTLVAGFLLIQYLGGSRKNSGDKTASTDSTGTNAFRIGYFEMDSIENNYEKVKEVKKDIAAKDESYSSELQNLEGQMRRKIQSYQQRGDQMTEQDVANAQADLKRLEDKLKKDKQLLDEQYQDFVMRRNLDIRKQIEDYIAKYNKEKGFSYIVSYEPGLFYYKDTLYNITEDLLKGLNKEYNASKK